MDKRTRLLIVVGVGIALCGVYVWLFGVQTLLTLQARSMKRKFPVIKETPVALTDLSISQALGQKLSYFGYEFEVPWKDVDESRTRTIGGGRAVIAFRSGNALSFWMGPPHKLPGGYTAPEDGNLDEQALRTMFGDEVMKSDYEFDRVMLETTPRRITPFIPKKAAIRRMIFLSLKSFTVPMNAESGIYSVAAGEFKGFQFGKPPIPRGGLIVELYSDNGSLDFIFGQKLNGPTMISQGDINRILHTLRRVPAEP